MVPQKFNY
jgi:hypothetical protein